MEIRAVTYNVFHCAIPETGKINYDKYAKVIVGHKGAFVFLQEVDKGTTRSAGVNQAKKLAGLAGYPYWAFGKAMNQHGGEYGNAILSKYELSNVIVSNLGKIDTEPRCLIAATVTVGGKKIRIGSTHISGRDAEGNKQITNMKPIVTGWTYPCLIGGDYNCEPTSTNGKLLDSFLDYKRPSGIDHILCRGPWVRVSQVKIDDGNGDHDPVVGVFTIA
jgi:endonuclease/exonuclease/phosphatase family metal-dependent hydrolase